MKKNACDHERELESYVLYEGDSITCGLTHQIKVGRDKSWIKYEAHHQGSSGEETESARTRAVGHVNESVMEAVQQDSRTVRSDQVRFGKSKDEAAQEPAARRTGGTSSGT